MDLYRALDLRSGALAVVAFIGAGGKSTAMFRLAQEIVARGGRVVTTTTTRIAADQIRAAPAFASLLDGADMAGGSVLPMAQLRAALDRHNHCLLIGRKQVERGPVDKKAGIDPTHIDELAGHARALQLDAILVEADGSRMLPIKAPAAHEPVVPRSATLVVAMAGMDALGRPIADPHVHRPEAIRAILPLPRQGPERLTPSHVARLLAHQARQRRNLPPTVPYIAFLNKVDTPPRLAWARLIAQELAMVGQMTLLGAVAAAGKDPVRERWGPTAVVVLAAGGSTRMGAPKQVLTIDDDTLVVRAARLALQSGPAMVLVVVGAHAAATARALAPLQGRVAQEEGLDVAGMARLRLVQNDDWAMGQASSIAAALAALPEAIQAVTFLPVDQPFVPPLLLHRQVQAWRSGVDLVATTVDGERRGAPALFDRRHWPQLHALQGDQGGRTILARHAGQIVAIPASAAQLRDLDRPADLPPAANSHRLTP